MNDCEDGKQGGAMLEEVPHTARDRPLVKRSFVLGA